MKRIRKQISAYDEAQYLRECYINDRRPPGPAVHNFTLWWLCMLPRDVTSNCEGPSVPFKYDSAITLLRLLCAWTHVKFNRDVLRNYVACKLIGNTNAADIDEQAVLEHGLWLALSVPSAAIDVALTDNMEPPEWLTQDVFAPDIRRTALALFYRQHTRIGEFGTGRRPKRTSQYVEPRRFALLHKSWSAIRDLNLASVMYLAKAHCRIIGISGFDFAKRALFFECELHLTEHRHTAYPIIVHKREEFFVRFGSGEDKVTNALDAIQKWLNIVRCITPTIDGRYSLSSI